MANKGQIAPFSLTASFQPSRLLIWPIIAVGVLLRLLRYANGRSLWFDEALLALNIIHRSPIGLLRPLNYHQGAPLGYLLLVKLATTIGGNGELALRAIPLLAALLSLFLFWRVAESYLSPRAVPLAVALFCLSPVLIASSSEAKQYSSDVALTLLLLWAATKLADPKLADHGLSRASLLKYAVLGATSIWFSHPASFVLAGIATTLLVGAYSEHNRTLLWKRLLLASTWGSSFLLCYFVSLRFLAADQALLHYWRDSFPPHPLASFQTATWIAGAVLKMFDDPAGLVDFLGLALFVAGGLALIRRNRTFACFLIAPIGFAFFASLLGRYPFEGRLLMFLAPLLLMVVAEGVVWISGKFRRFPSVIEALLTVALLFRPVSADAKEVVHPTRREDIKLAIRYIQAHQQPGDVWFVYHWARYQFWYYDELYKISPSVVRIGKDCGTDTTCYESDLDRLRGNRRVWILFSHIWIGDGLQEEDMSVQYLDRLGKRLDRFSATGVRAYLYNLGQSGQSAPW